MAIQINGNGTITGISVGGLPNGIVDTDMLAANAVSAAKLASGAGGKVLQVVSSSTTTQQTNESGTFTDTNLSGSITPSSTSSKILVTVSQAYEFQRANTEAGCSIRLLRDSTVIDSAVASDGGKYKLYLYTNAASSYSMYNCYSVTVLDSPNTTSAITYKTQSAVYIANNSARIKSQSGSIPSYITMMEIAA